MRALCGALAVAAVASSLPGDGCNPGRPAAELHPAELSALHACVGERLHARYLSGVGGWRHAGLVRDYPEWRPASAYPAWSAAHGGFLVPRVNAEGFAAYTQYAEDPDMPVGALIAAESFTVSEAGAVEPGPLYLMEKVDYDRSPETMGWYYMAVGPDGAPMGIDPWSDCNDCHVGQYPHQGGLGYPPPEARIGR